MENLVAFQKNRHEIVNQAKSAAIPYLNRGEFVKAWLEFYRVMCDNAETRGDALLPIGTVMLLKEDCTLEKVKKFIEGFN